MTIIDNETPHLQLEGIAQPLPQVIEDEEWYTFSMDLGPDAAESVLPKKTPMTMAAEMSIDLLHRHLGYVKPTASKFSSLSKAAGWATAGDL